MFTGIIEEIGTIVSKRHGINDTLLVRAKRVLDDVAIGDSIAVAGVCLTVTGLQSNGVFLADVSRETARRTTIDSLSSGAKVNLERAMKASSRFGGHIVQGHVDGVGNVLEVKKEGGECLLYFTLPQSLLHLVVEKGSIAIDGASLTVAGIQGDKIWISAIPHTLEETTLQYLSPGAKVNVECDIIGKYISSLLPPH